MRGARVGDAREIARRWVADAGGRTPGFAGAFLHGSINWLPDDAHLPETSDLDVMVVLEGGAPVQKPGKFRYDSVLLEVSHLTLAEVATPEQVLSNAHLAGSFHRPSVLADPTGHLDALQQEVARHYAAEAWVLRRCADVEAKMRRPFPPPAAPFPDQVNAWLFPTGLTTHLLLVAGLRNPTVRLRYLAVRDLLAEQDRLDAYDGLLADLGVLGLTPQRATAHLDALEAAFLAAAGVIRSPFFFAADISAAGYPVAIEGARELIARGDHREAVFWLAATAVRCQQVFAADAPELLPRHEPGFRALLAELGLHDWADLLARREAMLARLP
ncbi:MAG: hypothetical protein KC442_00395, partial [Thermomicrobiales bacterium]|nr:hypothetical protein [Thermomicrobiales bacterium]